MFFISFIYIYILIVLPIMVIEFLEQIYTTINSYFGGFNENIIKEHFVTIYQVNTFFFFLN